MKILHCVHSLDCGGLQRQLSYLAPAQVKNGHKVYIAYLRGKFFVEKMALSGIKLHHIKNISTIHPKFRIGFSLLDPRVIIQLKWLIKKIQPDIIQTWFREMDIPAGMMATIYHIPWVLREANSYRKWPNTIFNLLRRYIGKKSNAIIANSQAGEKYWIMSKYLGYRRIIKNALPFDYINKSKNIFPDIGLSENEDYILYAGRINSRIKNMDTLISAIINIVSQTRIKAVICGDGPYKPRIKKVVKKYHLEEKIILSDYLQEDQLWNLMKKARLFVSASKIEGCPNVILEAMACGCPIVLSDIPEHREFLDDSLAFFVDQNDPNAISAGIQKALKSPKEARKKAEMAKILAKNWQSVESMVKDYENVYKEIIAIKARKRAK